MTVQDILKLDAKEVAAAAAFGSAIMAYQEITQREDFFLNAASPDEAAEAGMADLHSAIYMLGAYAIDRKAAGPVVVTHAKRAGLIDEDQAEDLYVELALTIFAAHAISAHEAITALQERLRKALAEAEADQGGRVTTMALKDSIFAPVGSSLEIDPERAAALALGARAPLDEGAAAGIAALSLGAPETEPDGAIKLGKLDEGDGGPRDADGPFKDGGEGDGQATDDGDGDHGEGAPPEDSLGADGAATGKPVHDHRGDARGHSGRPDKAGSAGKNPAHAAGKSRNGRSRSKRKS